MNEITKVEQQPPVLSRFTWDGVTTQQIKELFMPGGATDAELLFFMRQCEHANLDPFKRQIVSISRWDAQAQKQRRTTQVTIDGLRVIAERTNRYRGQLPIEWCGMDGRWKDIWLSKEPPVAARASVLRQGFDQPMIAVAKYDSYVQTNKAGTANHIWSKMPDIMVGKCAEAMALRKAFPDDAGGLYTHDEMGNLDVAAEVTQGQTIDSTAEEVDEAAAYMAELEERLARAEQWFAECDTAEKVAESENTKKTKQFLAELQANAPGLHDKLWQAIEAARERTKTRYELIDHVGEIHGPYADPMSLVGAYLAIIGQLDASGQEALAENNREALAWVKLDAFAAHLLEAGTYQAAQAASKPKPPPPQAPRPPPAPPQPAASATGTIPPPVHIPPLAPPPGPDREIAAIEPRVVRGRIDWADYRTRCKEDLKHLDSIGAFEVWATMQRDQLIACPKGPRVEVLQAMVTLAAQLKAQLPAWLGKAFRDETIFEAMSDGMRAAVVVSNLEGCETQEALAELKSLHGPWRVGLTDTVLAAMIDGALTSAEQRLGGG